VTSVWPEPDSRGFVASRGLRLETCTWGDPATADITLLCLHGYLDCAAVFAPLAHELIRRPVEVAVVAMSFAGHGGSDRADSYGWFDHVVDVMRFLDEWRVRPGGGVLGVAGHSFGAVQMLEALNLDACGVDFAVNLDAVAGPFGRGAAGLGEALATVATSGLRKLPYYASLEDMVARRQAFNPRLPPATMRRLVSHLAVHDAHGWRWRVDPALVGWIRPWDLATGEPSDPLRLTGRLPLEVLTVTGDAPDEPRIRGAQPRPEVVEAVPNVRHVGLATAGHYVHLETTGLVADAILHHAGVRGGRAAA
jgi:pimeloyl-ACP methyl ester carboxylesterase